jgi:hypothetical protein
MSAKAEFESKLLSFIKKVHDEIGVGKAKTHNEVNELVITMHGLWVNRLCREAFEAGWLATGKELPS